MTALLSRRYLLFGLCVRVNVRHMFSCCYQNNYFLLLLLLCDTYVDLTRNLRSKRVAHFLCAIVIYSSSPKMYNCLIIINIIIMSINYDAFCKQRREDHVVRNCTKLIQIAKFLFVELFNLCHCGFYVYKLFSCVQRQYIAPCPFIL